MAVKDLINLGISPDSGTGDSARRGGEKINNLFADLYANFGDNPLGNDPNGPFYGYRRPFYEYEYKVGELHPAGKFTTVRFKTTSAAAFDTNYGYGVDSSGAFVDADADQIPDIYRDSEWYFLTRGEQVSCEMSEIATGGVAHFVLPLAKAGDVVKIRDSFGTWNGKYISVWTTPYEFQSATQVTEWKANTPINNKVYPDSDSISVRRGDGTFHAVNYKRPVSPIVGTYPLLEQPFEYTTTGSGKNVSKVTFYDKENTELEFTYRGPDSGWMVKERLMLSTFDQIQVLQDNFDTNDWLQWDAADLTVTNNGYVETEILTGQWILCVAPSAGGDTKVDVKASTTPVTKVYRRVKEDTTSSEASAQVISFLRTKIQAVGTGTEMKSRIEAVLGENDASDQLTDGFLQSDPSTFYREITLSQIADTSGNIILIASEPFSGFVQLLVPQA